MNLFRVFAAAVQKLLPQRLTFAEELALLQQALTTYTTETAPQLRVRIAKLPQEQQSLAYEFLLAKKLEEAKTFFGNVSETLPDADHALASQARTLREALDRHARQLTVYCEQSAGVFTSEQVVRTSFEILGIQLAAAQTLFFTKITRAG